MISDRDSKILEWIRNYHAISVKQCTNIFFKGNYEGCRRRLKQLEGYGLIKSYTSSLKAEKVYYIDRKLSNHDLLIYDFISKIYELGGTLEKIQLQPHYLDNSIIPDAYVEIIYKDNLYLIFLEVDLTHYTNSVKMQTYEKLYKSREAHHEEYNVFPIILIARPRTGVRYNSHNFEVIYTSLRYDNLKELLFQEI